jgi:hypothetical protein
MSDKFPDRAEFAVIIDSMGGLEARIDLPASNITQQEP